MEQLTNEQQKLIIENYKLLNYYVQYTIKSKQIPRCLEDEFESDMHMKFCMSAMKYDIKTGFKFSTYAYGGFRLGLRDLLTRKKAKFEKVNYVEEVSNYEVKQDGTHELKSNLVNDLVEDATLTQRERTMIEDYYYYGVTFEKIGEKFGLTKAGASFVIKGALRKLRVEAKKDKLDMGDFYT